jgi:hypothetical protein
MLLDYVLGSIVTIVITIYLVHALTTASGSRSLR